MTGSVRIACVQTNSGPEIDANIKAIAPLLDEAVDRGAALVGFPEMVGAIVSGRREAVAAARPEKDHPALDWFRRQAHEKRVHILVGSLAIALGDEDGSGGERLANRSYLIGPDGAILASYDKIHMFDVDLAEGESYRESATYRPGTQAVVVETPVAPIGMTVCYDVRFPHLYRHLAQAGARLLTVPSAFTVPTGQAHWRTLLRARAIETGCFVMAPAQCGEHHKGRKTHGHSMIVDPWGAILAEAGEEPEVVCADIDLAAVDGARRMVPSLSGDRTFAPASPVVQRK